MAKSEFIEGIHFYFNEESKLVFTAKYLLERGFCCGDACLNCPYNYENVPDDKKQTAILKRKLHKKRKEDI